MDLLSPDYTTTAYVHNKPNQKNKAHRLPQHKAQHVNALNSDIIRQHINQTVTDAINAEISTIIAKKISIKIHSH